MPNLRRSLKVITSQMFVSLVLLAVLVAIAMPIIKNYRQRQAVDQEIANLQAEIAQAQAENNEFRKMIDYLESDQFVEEQARLNLGLKKPGEEVVVIQTSDAPAVEGTVGVAEDLPLINEQALKLVNNFKKWLSYFFDPNLTRSKKMFN